MKQLLKFLEETPDDDFLNYAIAMEYMGAGDLDKALELLMNLKERNPEYLATYYQLGKILETKSETEKARSIFKRGHELAIKQKENKTAAELQSAINLLDD
ncbi:MAG: tetratricopeptide repeat protein [Bacteroidia bacterium]|nr:tetratricopeptide repeat protein [Bacteroidia bacterium]